MTERFAVSTEGMAQLHRGRPVWQLLKELVANAWDEGANCTVHVQFIGPHPRPEDRPGRWSISAALRA